MMLNESLGRYSSRVGGRLSTTHRNTLSLPAVLPKGYLLDCPLSVVGGLKTHLKLYKLRSKVKIKDATTLYDVLVSGVQDPWQASESGGGEDPSPLPVAAGGRFADPRCATLGVRAIRPKGEAGKLALLLLRLLIFVL